MEKGLGKVDKMPQIGFIRTKVLQADKPGGLTSPFVAVNVKEAMNVPGEWCSSIDGYMFIESKSFYKCSL